MIIQSRPHGPDPRTHRDQILIPHASEPLVVQDRGGDLRPVGRGIGDFRALEHLEHGLRVLGYLVRRRDDEDAADSLSCGMVRFLGPL